MRERIHKKIHYCDKLVNPFNSYHTILLFTVNEHSEDTTEHIS